MHLENASPDPTDIDPRGEIWYCSNCDKYLGQTGGPSCGKTVVLITCSSCMQKNLMERAEHE